MVSVVYLIILAVLTFFGVVHSALPDGAKYLPWTLDALMRKISYQFTPAYVVLAVMLALLSLTKESREPRPDDE